MTMLACTVATIPVAPLHAQVTSPKEFFGFDLGSDGNYASWDKEVEYFKKLAEESDRVQTSVVGKSTQGNPFLVMTISSPENLAKAARYQEIARKMADPRGLSQAEIDSMAEEGKVVVLMTLGQHSTEVASSQVGPLLVHQLATGTDDQTKAILKDAILVLIPSFNPDGLVMVKEWTNKTKGTSYQGSYLPYLYHYYVGHDNNRDGYMLNMVESKLWAKVAYEQWHPQIYQDTHQMGSYGARLFLPPKTDPVLPEVQPIVWREMMILGAAMATQLEAAGIKGVETQAGAYTGWQMPTFHGMTPARNIVGFHTESASSQMIWPLEIKPDELEPADRGRPGNYPQVNFPNPWPGGTWRMGDIVRQQKIALLASLETAARQHKMFLSNMALMANNQIKKGASEAPYAYVIPMDQHDPGTAAKMIDTLMEAKVEVHRATQGFQAGSQAIKPGDYVIRSDQPLRGYILSLLVPYIYPDNPSTRNADGTPLRPKDFASTNLAELMGVNVIPVTTPLTAKLALVSAPPAMTGGITGSGSAGWLLTPDWNDSFRAVNKVLAEGGAVYRLAAPPAPWDPGTFWIPAGGAITPALVQQMATDFGLPFTAVGKAPSGESYALKPLKVGLYRRYYGGNSDEGWTRWIFDDWKFPYSRIQASDVLGGSLNAKFDTIILPDDSIRGILAERPRNARAGEYPPEYTQPLGEAGVERLKEFARAGGTLVFIDRASELAIEKFGIPVKNSVSGLSTKEFYSPGSMIRVHFDKSDPLAYGMPDEGLVMFDDSPAFEVAPDGSGVDSAAQYPPDDLLKSGWLDGAAHIANKSALLDIKYGEGRLVLIGFGPQTRGETHGTYKILFNSLYLDK